MRVCKYCNKPIAEKDIWNPDSDGNGYHHRCLIKMEFDARDKRIYDKGKIDVLDKIRAEIKEKYGNYDICEWFEDYDYEENDVSEYRLVGGVSDILAIIDRYRAESGVERGEH